MKFFIIMSYFLIYTYSSVAQNYNQAPAFFMPQQEIKPKQEKLPPIQNTNQINNQIYSTPDAQYDVKYVLVNGVYVPTFTKRKKIIQETENTVNDERPNIKRKNTKTKSAQSNNADEKQNQLSVTEQKPTVNITAKKDITDPNFPPPEEKQIEKKTDTPSKVKYVELPFETTIDNNLPPYRNIFAQYLNDTLTFQKENIFPENEALSQALKKASSGKEITVFKGTIKPSIK
ncbi:MAG: hypothetical protein IJ019_02175 [Alphaproteobacteria bacterium]|nr:hypothetical protein [Alphaproteobacteria bacterium]